MAWRDSPGVNEPEEVSEVFLALQPNSWMGGSLQKAKHNLSAASLLSRLPNLRQEFPHITHTHLTYALMYTHIQREEGGGGERVKRCISDILTY